jgi:hypothetical protein
MIIDDLDAVGVTVFPAETDRRLGFDPKVFGPFGPHQLLESIFRGGGSKRTPIVTTASQFSFP